MRIDFCPDILKRLLEQKEDPLTWFISNGGCRNCLQDSILFFFFTNPLENHVVRHLPSTETVKDQSLAVALREGTLGLGVRVFSRAKQRSFLYSSYRHRKATER